MTNVDKLASQQLAHVKDVDELYHEKIHRVVVAITGFLCDHSLSCDAKCTVDRYSDEHYGLLYEMLRVSKGFCFVKLLDRVMSALPDIVYLTSVRCNLRAGMDNNHSLHFAFGRKALKRPRELVPSMTTTITESGCTREFQQAQQRFHKCWESFDAAFVDGNCSDLIIVREHCNDGNILRSDFKRPNGSQCILNLMMYESLRFGVAETDDVRLLSLEVNISDDVMLRYCLENAIPSTQVRERPR